MLASSCLLLTACEAQVAHPDFSGTWTPVSTADCGPNGETIRFTGERILYSVNGTRRKVGDILGVEKTSEGWELRYTARAGGTPSDQAIAPMRFLFVSEKPDQLKAVAEAIDGEALSPIEDAELQRVFDLERCA